jgi:hypothetical protein
MLFKPESDPERDQTSIVNSPGWRAEAKRSPQPGVNRTNISGPSIKTVKSKIFPRADSKMMS